MVVEELGATVQCVDVFAPCLGRIVGVKTHDVSDSVPHFVNGNVRRLVGEHLRRPCRRRNGNDCPTQIVSHCRLAEVCHSLARSNVCGSNFVGVTTLVDVGVACADTDKTALVVDEILRLRHLVVRHFAKRFLAGIKHIDSSQHFVSPLHKHAFCAELISLFCNEMSKVGAVDVATNYHFLPLLHVCADTYGKFGKVFHLFVCKHLILLWQYAAFAAAQSARTRLLTKVIIPFAPPDVKRI